MQGGLKRESGPARAEIEGKKGTHWEGDSCSLKKRRDHLIKKNGRGNPLQICGKRSEKLGKREGEKQGKALTANMNKNWVESSAANYSVGGGELNIDPGKKHEREKSQSETGEAEQLRIKRGEEGLGGGNNH